MGFYGNISNSAKTNLTFDIIYPNRVQMEQNMSKDGVYIGRFALIEYDDATTVWREAFTDVADPSSIHSGILFTNMECSVPYKFTNDIVNESYGIQTGDLVFVKNNGNGYYDYFKCIGKSQDNENALFDFLKSSDEMAHDNSYIINYNIDRKKYPNTIGRGWDSTVWQKVYDNGVEKYVMVAELNSVTPTFNLEADPPTSTPIIPHFDANSTNLFYTLHWQPTWGMRIKSSEKFKIPMMDSYGNELNQITASTHNVASTAFQNLGQIPSDISVKWSKTVLDSSNNLVNTWFKLNEEDEELGEWTLNPDEAVSVPAAIYFNKKGFDPKEICYSPGFDPQKFIYTVEEDPSGTGNVNNTVTDMITIEPTGRSGMVYQNHTNTAYEPAEDIQELSIMLPTIGNIVAKMWDMIYCGQDVANYQTDEDGVGHYYRKTDYQWLDGTVSNTSNGARLFTIDSRSGIPTLVPGGANSIAGCINSVHDLMGMIIVNSDEALPDVDDADINKIYFTRANNIGGYSQGYYRKKLTYEWDTESLDSFKAIDLIPFDRSAIYYHKEGVNYARALDPKDPRKFYCFENPKEDLVEVKFDGEFEKDIYYYKDSSSGTLKYILATNETPEAGVKYYTVEATQETFLFYAANRYYYQTELLEFEVDRSSKPTAGRVYFTRTLIYDEDTHSYKYTYKRVDDTLSLFDPITDPLFLLEGTTYVQLTTPPEGYTACYRLAINGEGTNFYTKNIYYSKTPDESLIFCGDSDFSEGNRYYKMVKAPIVIKEKFYYAGKYYYDATGNGDYVLDTSDEMTVGREYFEQGYLYVKEDSLGILPVGSVWRGDRENVPPTVTLAVKRDKYEMVLMPEFANALNTLNGLILKMNTMLEFDDEETRDTLTLRGCLNLLNDIIAKFTSLEGGDLAIVDEYGRICGVTPSTDKLLNIEVSKSVTNPGITFSHSASGVTHGAYGEVVNKNINFGESFKTLRCNIDKSGHITHAEEIEITLPSTAEQAALTGYTPIANPSGIYNIASTDKIIEAFAKMQANIEVLNARIAELEKQ